MASYFVDFTMTVLIEANSPDEAEMRAPARAQKKLKEEGIECLVVQPAEETLEATEIPPLLIAAEAHSDDGVVQVAFDATPYFESASKSQRENLVAEGYSQGYAADHIAQQLAGPRNNLGDLFAYIEIAKRQNCGGVGFEVRLDEEAAKAWLRKHRPHIEVDSDS